MAEKIKLADIVSEKLCTGCGACATVCPVECISMMHDKDGFVKPFIDEDKCIHCDKCKKTCPVLSAPGVSDYTRKSFVVKHKDEKILRKSTSGGAFSAIARGIIEMGGIVYGAAYDENFIVRHMAADNMADVSKFRGSKYVQSDLGNVFREIKEHISNGKTVLFSGTPCQVAGLVKYVGEERGNLYTLDVVCHGITTPLLFEKYIKLQKEKYKDFDNVVFRDKYYGYEYTIMSLYKGEKCIYHNGIEYDPELKLFFSGVSMRESCAQCSFKTKKRCSDFTIFDTYYKPAGNKEFDDNKGATNVIVHTKKAEELFESVKSYIKYIETDYEAICSAAREMTERAVLSDKREEFFCDLEKMDGESIFKKYTPVTPKVILEKFVRIFLARTGLYSISKKVIGRVLKK